MPLKLTPTRIKSTLYLRIPKDIKDLHSIEDVAEATQVTKSKALVVARFLARFGFVEFDEASGNVRIDRKTRAWYTEAP